MRRRIDVKADIGGGRTVSITATVDSARSTLSRDDVAMIVDVLTDRLIKAVRGLPYGDFYLPKVTVNRKSRSLYRGWEKG